MFKTIKKLINKLKPQSVYSATKEYNIVISKEQKLKNKNVIVTGGNGSIGRAICFKLAAEGAKVFVSGRNKTPYQSLKAYWPL